LNAPCSISRNLLVQRNTPREVRGRVNSAFFVTRDVGFLLGMAAAGLADAFGVRSMMLASAALVLIPGALALVLPGLAQPASEWRKAVSLLRSAKAAPATAGRMATLADFDLLAGKLPLLAALPDKERRQLITQSCVVDAPEGSTILARGDQGDDVYFILSGEAVAGIQQESGDYRSLETMYPGDFFGEIAALMATPRTANVVASAPMRLFQVPGPAFRRLMENPGMSQLVHRKFLERMARTNLDELPRFAGYDQAALRELRTEAA
jgi:CRP-like cAMP-binding protein